MGNSSEADLGRGRSLVVNSLIDNAKELNVTLQVRSSQRMETSIFILSKGLWKGFVKALEAC